MKRSPILMAAILVAVAQGARGQEFRQFASVHDNVGGLSENTVLLNGVAYRHVGAGGQPGGIASSAAAASTNQAGFLHAVDIKRPNLDTDGDGVPDELDADNDEDGLTDRDEVTGNRFDPTTLTLVNNPDTDGDEVPDGAEASAGTDPTDEAAFLLITAIRPTAAGQVITWLARGGKQYRLLSAEGSHAYPTHTEGIMTAQGGLPPWFETEGGFTNAAGSSFKCYGIQAVP